MREQQHQTSQLSIAQVLAGALASVSAAVVASTFGLTGTLLGAAITSIVATIGGALYKHSLERAHARVRVRIHRNPRTGAVTHEVLPPAPPPRRSLAWGAVAGGAALAFLLALGALTAVEAIAKEPVARLLGRPAPPQARTTIGGVLQDVTARAPGGDTAASAPPLTATAAAVTPTRPATTPTTEQRAPTATITVAPAATKHPTPSPGPNPTPTAPAPAPPAASPHR